MSERPDELLDRTRRIETRITKIGIALGIDVGGGAPVWDPRRHRVIIPSPNCSIKSCVDVVPNDFRRSDVDVYVGEDFLTVLCADPD